MRDRRLQMGLVAAAVVLLALSAPVVLGQAKGTAGDVPAIGKGGAKPMPKTIFGSMKALWEDLYKVCGRTWYGLFGCAVLGLASILERTVSLALSAMGVSGPLAKVRPLWAQERFDEIGGLLKKKKGITAKLIDFILHHRDYHITDVSTGVGDVASRFIKRHVRRNYPLAVVATIAPLLGLLGTVIGMIEAFEKVNIAGSMGSAEYLSGAISKALVTTEVGLMIAIPSLFFYNVFKFFTGVMADTLEGKTNEMVLDWMMRKETV